jgi:phage-related minor tail protein
MTLWEPIPVARATTRARSLARHNGETLAHGDTLLARDDDIITQKRGNDKSWATILDQIIENNSSRGSDVEGVGDAVHRNIDNTVAESKNIVINPLNLIS